MSELRDAIGGVVCGVAHDKYGMLKWPEATDRILALVREAMLSDEAVDAAALNIKDHFKPDHYFIPGNHGPTPYMPWDERPDMIAKLKSAVTAKDQIQAALDAAGIRADDE